jgi:hypothetical protein
MKTMNLLRQIGLLLLHLAEDFVFGKPTHAALKSPKRKARESRGVNLTGNAPQRLRGEAQSALGGYSALCGAILAMSTIAQAAPMEWETVPLELERWRAWVLHGQTEALCPMRYNDGAVTHCRWPSRLDLEVGAEGGRFEQRWLVFARGWVSLPGGQEAWPDAVTVDGAPAAVIDRGGQPMVELAPGEHRLIGRFFWSRRPEMIAVPPELGLLSLSIDGQKVSAPLIDVQGRLWLQKSETATGAQDRMESKIFRLIDDTIPLRLTTLLRLAVSGGSREVLLERILPETAVPMELVSRLPARLDTEGRLRVQARAGQWEIRIVARMPAAVRKMVSPGILEEEIWSFNPRHDLRMVEIEGAAPVEPTQTEMPAEWRPLPAYLIKTDTELVFKEIRRGDPQPAPDRLNLRRTLWLDFDGDGFTVHDRIDGILSRRWNLSVNAPLQLGRVAVDGENRVITEQGPSKKAGVELRRGQLALEADARLPRDSATISAVGWDQDFESVAGVLNLPPGWRLMAAAGVDEISDTWLQRWTLLDLFLVLIVALAVFKLRGRWWGLVALGFMALSYHEPDAPRLIWLHIVAVLAIYPRIAGGWIKKTVALWGIGAAIVLSVIAVPFAVYQLRWGVYPQLAPADVAIQPAAYQEKLVTGGAVPESMTDEEQEFAVTRMPRSLVQAPAPSERKESEMTDQTRWRHEPDALIPTGPGLPDWQWRAVHLSWNGPVAADQTARLYLISPLLNLLVAVLRVGLLAALLYGLVQGRAMLQRLRPPASVAAGVLTLLLLLYAAPGPGAWAADHPDGFPPPSLLEELRQRLLEKPDCLPYCADISRLELSLINDQLQLMLKVNAARRTAVPLPVDRKSWNPDQILMDNAPLTGLIRDNGGRLWAYIPQGLHTVVLTGRVDQEGVLQIPLAIKPHIATFTAAGWEVKGIHADGRVDAAIQLTRLQQEARGQNNNTALSAFMQIERRLRLGLTWVVYTTVRRATPTGTAIVAGVPLLTGEAVTTGGITVDQGQALVNLAADQTVLSYASTLPIAPKMELTAPRNVPWTEVWVLEAGPIWHCELEGIPAIHHRDGEGQWQPRWQPWPGESVTIVVTRPPAAAGRQITIDRADVVLTPGQRSTKTELNLVVRTSRGVQHTLELPPKANLQSVTLDGQTLPVRQDGAFVTVPLTPGAQTVNVQWHQPTPFGAWFQAPQINLSAPAVNARVAIQMPANRWILWVGGPRWGPAVLFWSHLAILILAALALGRFAPAPLKSWQWLLLVMGLTQIHIAMALVIVGWLLILSLRERRSGPTRWYVFDAMQIGLAMWTVAALVCLFLAIKAGLIGDPQMQIEGNHSAPWNLNWTQDRIDGAMPQPWVLSLPVWVYRVLMLFWSFWLAWALLHWLKWGWGCFTKDGAWRRRTAP